MFDDTSNNVTAKIFKTLAESPKELYYSLLLLDRWPGKVPELNIAPGLPLVGSEVFISSYPGGGGLQISLEDNEMVEVDLSQEPNLLNEHTFSYRTPTLAGSSGAPIFNQNWELIGIHVGRGKSANFGINIKAIIEDARQKLLGIAITEDMAIKIKETIDHGKRKYSSVFISYNHSDSVFANRLYNALQANCIRAWIDVESMLPGANIYEKIQEGIQQNDKVLLCCSKHSLGSGWVDSEIKQDTSKGTGFI